MEMRSELLPASIPRKEPQYLVSRRLFRTFWRGEKNSLATARIQTRNYPQ